ncbi:MAG: glycosyltransferase family 4 protein [Phycisphaerales bacterium JB039]
MADRIADALIIVLDEGQSLAHRAALGDFQRDGALWDALRGPYERLVLITHGGPDDLAAGERLGPEISVVCNAQRLATHMYVAAAAEEALGLLAGARSVVVRTEEMMAGASAIEIVEGLRRAGLRVGFVGRGGYLWSRFIAVETGPGSQAARAAAYRERALCQAADVVIGATETMVADLAWRYALPRSITAVVPNWVIEHDLVRTTDQRDKATLMCVGALRPRKRIHLVVEAACLLKQSGVADPIVRLIGDGPDRPALEAMARRDGVELHFESSIKYDALLQRMAECTVFLATSSMESHPRTVLEAMSTAAPVIVADAPGLDAMVEHGVTGLRMAPEPQAFARAIEGLLGDGGWRDALGSAAMRSVATQYSPRRVAELELAMHERAIELAGAAPETYIGAVSFEEELLGADLDQARAAWRHSLLSFAGRFDRGDVFLRRLGAEIAHSSPQADAA